MRRTGLIGLYALALGNLECATTMEGSGSAGGTASARGARLPDQCLGDFGADDVARQFATFVQATNTFIGTADEIDGRLSAACRRMGTDLAMSEADLVANGRTTLAVCGQVTARIKADLAAARAEARVEVKLETTEPVCVTKVDEYRRCIQKCDTRVVQAGYVDFRCEGGELRGTCSAQCTGQCAVSVQGQCGGSCEGTCTGACNGTCYGVCDGQCAVRGPDGRCAGACSGTCRGTCTAGCSGTCSGRCVASARGSCGGECRGGCSVQYQEPVCTGRIVPPEVRTECREMCDSIQVSRRECTPGQARLSVDARGMTQAAARVSRIVQAVATHMPEIHAIGHRLQALREAGELMVRTAGGYAAAVGSLGATAVLCSAEAVAQLPRAVGEISVAFQVSVQVTVTLDATAEVN